MDKKVQLSRNFKIAMIILIVVGLISVTIGFLTEDGKRAWANLLLNNYYFLSVALGATFWLAIQSVTQSGWSAAYLRVPQAMSNYYIVSMILFAILFFSLVLAVRLRFRFVACSFAAVKSRLCFALVLLL